MSDVLRSVTSNESNKVAISIDDWNRITKHVVDLEKCLDYEVESLRKSNEEVKYLRGVYNEALDEIAMLKVSK